MKTTIDIADDLLRRAKSHAKRERLTLRELVEEALRRFLKARGSERDLKPVRPVVVHGETPLSEIANLHQLILDSYDEYAIDRLKRGEPR